MLPNSLKWFIRGSRRNLFAQAVHDGLCLGQAERIVLAEALHRQAPQPARMLGLAKRGGMIARQCCEFCKIEPRCRLTRSMEHALGFRQPALGYGRANGCQRLVAGRDRRAFRTRQRRKRDRRRERIRRRRLHGLRLGRS